MEVRAELVSTIRPRQTTESCRADDPSTFSPGNRLSSLTPTPTLSPGLNPEPAAGRLEHRGLVLSSVHRGGGLGLRGEVRMRAGFDTGERRVCG